MTSHSDMQITLRTPAELADALPYLMGFHPTDSVVMVALKGERGTFGGRLRLGIPAARDEWTDVAHQLAECLVEGSLKRGAELTGIIVFLCQDPAGDESPGDVMERLRPLAQRLRVACGRFDVPVVEALCLSAGRYWSYLCPDSACCPGEGTALAEPGTSAMAAAATYAGIQVRGSLREMEARLTPRAELPADPQTQALDAAGAALVPRILGGVPVVSGAPVVGDSGADRSDAAHHPADGGGPVRRSAAAERRAVRREILTLAARVLSRLAADPPGRGADAAGDAHDDALIADDEAASLIIGLQDRATRDRAAEWMEGRDAAPALRLWRALARRCVGPYREHATAPLTLAGWVAWSSGDDTAARVAFSKALHLDPAYTFASLLHQAVNEGLDPEPLRRSLRRRHRTARLRGQVRRTRPEGGRRPGERSRTRRRGDNCTPDSRPTP
ncbi:DUF4192 domain-containing protein [Streptomyces sp. NPDC051940]|uniref:DUF4192 domain-containing protein n=1 Tax=Streptomyces sp. NPDC051940 TaxID=3155675 RepID=UPI0034425C4E